MSEEGHRLAVIGTAGRDSSIEMSHKTWDWMVNDFKSRLTGNEHLISGGAAWADHLAVHAFVRGWVTSLTLHFPAPFTGFYYLGERGSAGSTANYYHQRFRDITGVNSLLEIGTALKMGAQKTEESPRIGMRALFLRNSKVAEHLDRLLAYTFKHPTMGGTGDTWKKCHPSVEKTHVLIPLDFQ